jgi:hypothetical protein
MKEFPYKQQFSATFKPIVSEEKDKYLALASLDELRKFIPNVDANTNIDLLPVSFNACVVNRVNKNGDVIDTATALATYKNFIHKPIDVEHDRKIIVGTIVSAGFSEFGTDKPLTEEQVKDMTGPFNITLGGVVWRVADSRLADIIEETNDPTSEHYLAVSASWELGFEEFSLVLIKGNNKNIEGAKLVTDAEEVDKLKNHLRALGGTGKVEEYSVYRMPSKGTLPLGIGLTETPAADVKGVAAPVEEKQTEASEKTTEILEKKAEEVVTEQNTVVANIEIDKKIENNSEKISQCEKNVVNRNSIMKLTLQDITDEKLKEVKASSIVEMVNEEINKASEKWVKEKTEKEDALKAKEADFKNLTEEHTKLKEDYEKIKAALDKIEAEKAEKDKQEKFDSRMNLLDEQFELTKEDREILATRVRDLDDAGFEKYHKELAVLMKSKVKASKEEKKQEVVASETTTEVVEKAVEQAEVEKENVTKSAPATQLSMKERFAKAFGPDNVKIVTNKR